MSRKANIDGSLFDLIESPLLNAPENSGQQRQPTAYTVRYKGRERRVYRWANGSGHYIVCDKTRIHARLL